MRRIKGLKDLFVDAVDGTTRLLQQTHLSFVERQVRRAALVEPIAEPARAAGRVYGLGANAVYGSIRFVTRGVGLATDTGWSVAERSGALSRAYEAERALATPQRSDAAGSPAWLVDVVQTAVNAAVGDHLRARGNTLDLGMTLRREGHEIPLAPDALREAYPEASGKLCVFVHGLGTTEWAWSIFADELWGDPTASFGRALAHELGYTPLYVRYNTGAHVSESGERLSALLEGLVDAYPVSIDEIVLVGHSMGGLVSRSAASYGERRGARWLEHLRHVVCIGSPHHGAPLEKAGNVLSSALRLFETPGTQVPAHILDRRSAGIKDLRFGYTVHDEWRGRDPDAFLEDNRRDAHLVDGVTYTVLAGTLTRDPDHPVGALLGDVLVRVPSATGDHPEPERRIPFRVRHVHGGLSHLHLANHPDVYRRLHDLLTRCPRF